MAALSRLKSNKFFWGLCAFLLWGGYFVYIGLRLINVSDQGLTVAWPVNWEVAQHFAYASFFAYNPPALWTSHHPLYFDTPFAYPFAADFFAGMFIRIGFSHEVAFVSLSVGTFLALVLVLYLFYFRELKFGSRALVAATIFFANGGLAFFVYVQEVVKNLVPPSQYYTYAKDIAWNNSTIAQLLGQRSLTLGIPATLLLILLLLRWERSHVNHGLWWRSMLLGISAGSLMIVHIHSYIVLLFFAFILFIKNPQPWKRWLMFGISGFSASFFWFYLFFAEHVTENLFSIHPGWQMSWPFSFSHFFDFWILNWGFFFATALWAICIRGYRSPFVVVGVIVFLFANFISLQPSIWDNAKFFVWAYLFLTIPVTVFLSDLWHKKFAQKVLAIFLFFAIVASGFLDLYVYARQVDTVNTRFIMSRADIDLAERFRSLLLPGDTVLIADTIDHWVSAYTGARILTAANSWLWTFGIDNTVVKNDIASLYACSNDMDELLTKYDIRYIVLGPRERANYAISEDCLTRYLLVLKNKDTIIYDVKKY
ncbi:MAG: hypothetical protein EXS68_03150 [Candidatus Ryanbacteria bacterium]|nr:hypothetical protein [Candidatus Ryanbacteria bacterium]